MKRFVVLIVALFLTFAVPLEAQSQSFSETEEGAAFLIGPHVGMDIGDIEDPFAGIDARITSMRLPVVINPTFDYYFVGEGRTFWSLSGNLLYAFGAGDGSFSFYGGAGLGIYRFSVEEDVPGAVFREGTTDVGANFLVGTMVLADAFTPFAELQYTTIFSEGSPTLFGIKGGILINF